MSVYRIRPHDVDDDVLSDEDFDDDELGLTEADLARALQTRIGGHESKRKKGEPQASTGKATHEQNSRRGVRVAQKVWARVDNEKVKESVVDTFDASRLKASLKAARASQKQDKPGLVAVEKEALPQVNKYASCKAKDINAWLKEI